MTRLANAVSHLLHLVAVELVHAAPSSAPACLTARFHGHNGQISVTIVVIISDTDADNGGGAAALASRCQLISHVGPGSERERELLERGGTGPGLATEAPTLTPVPSLPCLTSTQAS